MTPIEATFYAVLIISAVCFAFGVIGGIVEAYFKLSGIYRDAMRYRQDATDPRTPAFLRRQAD